jgi:pimeloyl-ACP methyl ester carboxylesterase
VTSYPFATRRLPVEGLRHLVAGLRDAARCVARDLPGFGLSDKPPTDAYRPEDQARRLAAFVDALGLKDPLVRDFLESSRRVA